MQMKPPKESWRDFLDNPTMRAKGASAELGARLHDALEAKLKTVWANRERLVEAFIAETGMLPSEAELVERHMSDGSVRVHVQKRGGT